MKIIKNIIVGSLIGTGLILPGVSGAVLAIAFGVYDEIIESIANLFKNFKKNVLFLTPFLIGMLLGVVLFGNFLLYLFNNYEVITKTAFLGLILGSLPIIIEKVRTNNKLNFKVNYFLIALILGVVLFLFDQTFKIDDSVANIDFYFYIKTFIGGILFSLGKIIPGISSSFMLMILGMYEYIINIIAHPFTSLMNQPVIIITFLIGFLFGIVLFSKTVSYLIKNYQYESYSSILGFLIGSLLILVPKYNFNIEFIYSIIAFSIFFAISYLFSVNEIKKK